MKTFLCIGLLLYSSICNAFTLVGEYTGPVISTDKVTYITGMVDMDLGMRYIDSIQNTFFMKGPRILVINSPGGYATVGEGIIQMIEAEKSLGTKFVCVVVGDASSMAFNILTHCDKRLAVRKSRSVVHKMRTYLPATIPATAKMLREVADGLEQADEPYRQANAKAMHLTLDEYDTYADNETNWTAVQLFRCGYLTDFAVFAK